tara:strand:+ start:1443 stop:2258 length:816 start_codon:yes stop_codon:yes gene_type:complete
MKIIRQITDLNKAIKKSKEIGFVPTMGGLHGGHESLIKSSKKKCKKTLVSIFVNPAQFNKVQDYRKYPRNINKDLKLLKRLEVDFVFIPSVSEIFKNQKLKNFKLNNSQKVLCAKYRKGHFEGVLNIMNRFITLILPKYVFMGEKDFQQLYLIKFFLQKKYKTNIISCKTIREKNMIALSTRNYLLNIENLKKAGFIAQELSRYKIKINKNRNKYRSIIEDFKKQCTKKYGIKIEYLEARNIGKLTKNIIGKKFKLFIAYYINKVRLIDNF